MNILVCIKRVPVTGGKITLTADQQAIDTRHLGFTISPHEECAVEEALRIVATHGGSSVVLTLGPDAASEQLRDAMAMGIDRAIHLETDGREWDALATADAIVEAIRSDGTKFDLLLFGNEAADTGDYQVGIRVAHTFDLPCVTSVKQLAIINGIALAKRDAAGGSEIFEIALPAVLTVKEGINLPRYPSLPGRLKAKKKEIRKLSPTASEHGMRKLRLKLPREQERQVQILGTGADAAPKVVELLRQLGLLQR